MDLKAYAGRILGARAEASGVQVFGVRRLSFAVRRLAFRREALVRAQPRLNSYQRFAPERLNGKRLNASTPNAERLNAKRRTPKRAERAERRPVK